MGEDRLHVVFGTGQVGSTLAAHLAGLSIAVRVVSQAPASHAGRLASIGGPPMSPTPKRPRMRPRAHRWSTSASTPPTHSGPELFPPLQRGVLAAAERTGALLVGPGEPVRLWPDRGQADDRGSPANRDDRQGPDSGGDDRSSCWPPPRRAGSAWRSGGRRTSLAPGVTQGSTLGERVFGNALACSPRRLYRQS